MKKTIVMLVFVLSNPVFADESEKDKNSSSSSTSTSTSNSTGGAGGTSSATGGAGGTSNSTGGTSNSTGGTSSVGSITTGASTSSATGGTTNSTSNSTSGNSAGGNSTSTNGNNTNTLVVNTVDKNSRENAAIAAAARIESTRIAAEAAKSVANAPIRNTPSVSGTPLITSNDTCMGSTTGSVNVPGFGASLGTTWTDDNCIMLKNSRALHNMGYPDAAVALMCNDPKNLMALELTGYQCPQTTRALALALATNQASKLNTNSLRNESGNTFTQVTLDN